MTSPNGAVPDGAYVSAGPSGIAGLNGLTEDVAKQRMRADVAPAFNRQRDGLWGTLQDLIKVIAGTYTGLVKPFVDGQLALNDRFALLADISGYATAYIPMDFYRPPNSLQTMPYTDRIGPQKNATVNGDGSITLAKGTWRLSAHLTTDQHDNLMGFMRLQVLRPDGSLYSMKETQKNIDSGKWNTFQCYHTVVCAEPGYKVRVQFQYNRGLGLDLLFRGGTHLSHLTADRMDLRTDNAVVNENVPKEKS